MNPGPNQNTYRTLIPKILVFFLVPLLVSLVCIFMYFSGLPFLEAIIVPPLPNLNPSSWREFGLLENLQHFYLLVILIMAFYGTTKTNLKWQKLFFTGVGVFTLFVLLEEIDYGLHYYELIAGINIASHDGVRNIHNIGPMNEIIKAGADFGIFLWFFVGPFILKKSRHPFIQYLAPHRWYIATLLAMLLMKGLAHGLRSAGFNADGQMNYGIAEFRELTVYYLFMIYVYDLVILRLRPKLVGKQKPLLVHHLEGVKREAVEKVPVEVV